MLYLCQHKMENWQADKLERRDGMQAFSLDLHHKTGAVSASLTTDIGSTKQA